LEACIRHYVSRHHFHRWRSRGRRTVLHVHEQRQVFQAMLGRRSGHFVQDRFRELLVELVFEARVIGYRRL